MLVQTDNIRACEEAVQDFIFGPVPKLTALGSAPPGAFGQSDIATSLFILWLNFNSNVYITDSRCVWIEHAAEEL